MAKSMKVELRILAAAVGLFVVVTLFQGFQVGLTASSAETAAYVQEHAVSLVAALGIAAVVLLAAVVWTLVFLTKVLVSSRTRWAAKSAALLLAVAVTVVSATALHASMPQLGPDDECETTFLNWTECIVTLGQSCGCDDAEPECPEKPTKNPEYSHCIW